MIRNIIFDLGNVVIEWNADRVYDKHFTTAELKNEFYATTRIKELNVELDRGLAFDKGLSQLAEKHPHYHEAIWKWKHSWTEMIGREFSKTINIMHELKAKGYNLYALTNWSAETFIYAEDNFSWLKEFIDIVVSGREGLIKPEPDIFNLLLKRNRLVANECVFIDDTLPNIIAARELGMIGIHFKSPQQLYTDLQQLQIV